jgi:hypothetical protein
MPAIGCRCQVELRAANERAVLVARHQQNSVACLYLGDGVLPLALYRALVERGHEAE